LRERLEVVKFVDDIAFRNSGIQDVIRIMKNLEKISWMCGMKLGIDTDKTTVLLGRKVKFKEADLEELKK